MSDHRHSFTLMLMAFVKDRPGEWIPASAFEQFGRQAWRTRISEARRKFEEAHDGTIENNTIRVRGHESNCPGELAWDIPGACQCARPIVATRSFYRYVPEPEAVVSSGHDLNTPHAGRLL